MTPSPATNQTDVAWLVGTTPQAALVVALGTVFLYLFFIGLTRLLGARIHARLSGFDILVVIVLGSVLGRSMIGQVPTLTTGIIVVVVLLGCEALLGELRRHPRGRALLTTPPVLLMAAGRTIDEELRRCHITADELRGQLRRAGVRHPGEVAAVILESTGDFSVLKRGEPIDPALLVGVRSAEQLPAELKAESPRG